MEVDADQLQDKTQSLIDDTWLIDLGLKKHEKNILTGNHWINDKIINAVVEEPYITK